MRQATGNSSIHLFIACLLLALPALAEGVKKHVSPREAEIQRAADGFEALMLQQLWQQMRRSNDAINVESRNNPFAPSRAEQIFKGMQDENMLKALAAHRPLGVGNLVAKQLKGELGVGPRNLLKSRQAKRP